MARNGFDADSEIVDRALTLAALASC